MGIYFDMTGGSSAAREAAREAATASAAAAYEARAENARLCIQELLEEVDNVDDPELKNSLKSKLQNLEGKGGFTVL